MDSSWFKNAIIYGVNVPTFQDGNGDGIGDFRGLTSRLEYLAGLGVDCLWLLPFYPSPRRDNGYDVSNYYGVDPKFGSMDDFREFVQEAKAYGMRVMIDLVVHHTSDRHPWFEAAKADRHSSYRDYYIWSDRLPRETETPFFPEVESGVWRYDPISRSYYHHGFYSYQPDLNFANVRVQDEVFRIVDFWLSFGVAGFRLDAADKIMGRKGLPGTEVMEASKYWHKIREYVCGRRPDAVLLAEADMNISEINKYVSGGEGIHMLLNFWVNQTIMYALASQQVKPLTDTLAELPTMPAGSQYVNFLRNLDELNISRLTAKEQKKVFREFGMSKRVQIYGRGIRRRLAPMLGGNVARIKQAFSLMFAMPGSPMLVYGDEIGMGDNLDMPERDCVRTPMQWASGSEHAGFSTAHSSHMIHRMVTDPKYTFDKVNVRDQEDDPDSLLSFMKRLIAVRKRCPLIGAEDFDPVPNDHTQVAVLKYQNDQRLVVMNNLSDKACRVKLSDPGVLQGLTEIFSDSTYGPPQGDTVELSGYGYRWFQDEH